MQILSEHNLKKRAKFIKYSIKLAFVKKKIIFFIFLFFIFIFIFIFIFKKFSILEISTISMELWKFSQRSIQAE